jgi:hypothetical protein
MRDMAGEGGIGLINTYYKRKNPPQRVFLNEFD